MFLISLAFVRLAIKPAGYPNMLVAAVSRSHSQPSVNHDGTLLHGACVTYDIS